jgi:hypothetical protein
MSGENASYTIDCSESKTVEGLNLTNMCDRPIIDALIMTLMYLLIVIVGLISNGSVILASIFERYGTIDPFYRVTVVYIRLNKSIKSREKRYQF